MTQTIELSISDRSFLDAQLLLREYSHRINNEFASAIGVISIAAARSANDQAKAALTAIPSRSGLSRRMYGVLERRPNRGKRNTITRSFGALAASGRTSPAANAGHRRYLRQPASYHGGLHGVIRNAWECWRRSLEHLPTWFDHRESGDLKTQRLCKGCNNPV